MKPLTKALCLITLSLSTLMANANETESWLIKVDCCKASGCYVSSQYYFDKQRSKAKLFSGKHEAQEFLQKMSSRLKRQNPKIVPRS